MINLEGDFRKLTAHAGEGDIFVTVPDDTQATIVSNSDGLRGEGIEVAKTGSDGKLSKYRLGKGGAPFHVETEGEIHLRSLSSLKTTF